MTRHPGNDEKRRFGIEEEYLLLDATSGEPSNRAAEVAQAANGLGDRIEREFFASQLETATPVCREMSEAEEILTDFRVRAMTAAKESGVILAGTGLPPVGGESDGVVTPKPRYRAIDSEMRDVSARQYSTGTHVHVEVPSRDVGVGVLTRFARWVPALLALTANSPIWDGHGTGFASWRHVRGLSWPLAGYPPPFTDNEEYSRVLAQLVDSGIIIDSGILTWVARLSENYPTVEIRLADAQLSASDAVAFAALVRALVEHAIRDEAAGAERPRLHPSLVDGANWIAARNGLASDLVDPKLGSSVAAFSFIDRMVDNVAHILEDFGDRKRVADYLIRRRYDHGPSQVQLDRYAVDGISGLLKLYEESGQELLAEKTP